MFFFINKHSKKQKFLWVSIYHKSLHMWCCNKNNNGLWKRYYKNENIFKLGEFHHVANKFNETIGRAIMETLGKQYSIKINRGSHPQKPDRSTKKVPRHKPRDFTI